MDMPDRPASALAGVAAGQQLAREARLLADESPRAGIGVDSRAETILAEVIRRIGDRDLEVVKQGVEDAPARRRRWARPMEGRLRTGGIEDPRAAPAMFGLRVSHVQWASPP
jgi:hypothetical protein